MFGLKEWQHPYQTTLKTMTCHDGTALPITVIGSGEPVVLLHALGMDARQFLPFVLPLASRYQFYLPHFRGYGLAKDCSSSTQFDFIEHYADDLEAILTEVCQQHKVAAVPVAAISMGALVVWAYLQRYTCSTNNGFKDHPVIAGQSNGSDANKQTKNSRATPHTCNGYKTGHGISCYLNIDQVPAVHNQPGWQGGVFGDNQSQIFAQFRQVLNTAMPYLPLSLPTHQSAPSPSKLGSSKPSSHKPSSSDATAPAIKFIHLPYTVKRSIVETERAFAMLAVSRKHTQWLTNITRYQTPYKLGLYNDDTWLQKMRCLQAYVELPYDYRASIEKIAIPVTFLIGGQSKLYAPKWQRAIANQLPNSTIVELPQSGHAVPVDAPIKFAKVLKNFVNGQ